MSEVLINNTALSSCYFNDSAVKEIYVNDVKVFPAGWQWPGISNALMEDIHLLCQAKANGDITEWPDDLKVDKAIGSYRASLNGDVLYSLWAAQGRCRIFGIETDAPNTITFYSQYASSNFQKTYGCNSIEEVRELCRTVVPNDPTNPWKDYIQPITRRWYDLLDDGTYGYHETVDYFWVPSVHDLNLVETTELNINRTEGYPYFSTADARRMTAQGGSIRDYQTGSRMPGNESYLYGVSSQGNLNSRGKDMSVSTISLPFFWVIG